MLRLPCATLRVQLLLRRPPTGTRAVTACAHVCGMLPPAGARRTSAVRPVSSHQVRGMHVDARSVRLLRRAARTCRAGHSSGGADGGGVSPASLHMDWRVLSGPSQPRWGAGMHGIDLARRLCHNAAAQPSPGQRDGTGGSESGATSSTPESGTDVLSARQALRGEDADDVGSTVQDVPPNAWAEWYSRQAQAIRTMTAATDTAEAKQAAATATTAASEAPASAQAQRAVPKQKQLSKRLTQYRAGLALLAEAMQQTGLSIHGFRLEDSAFALAALARLRANNPTRAPVGKDVPIIRDATETRKLRHFLSLAHAAYLDSDEELFAKTTVMPGDLLTSAWEVVDLVPAHFVAVCHHSKTIVVSVRGTWALADALLNSCTAPEPLGPANGNGKTNLAHRGSVVAARLLLDSIADVAMLAASQHPMYSFAFTGHSFGGSIAAVMGCLLRQDMPNLHVYTFSTMPCMSRELAGRCSEFVTTVVNGDDVVPRLHRQNIDKLRAELAEIPWATALRDTAVDEATRERIVSMTRAAQRSLEAQRAAVTAQLASLIDQTTERLGLLRRLEALRAEISHNQRLGQDVFADKALQRRLATIMWRLWKMDTQVFKRIKAIKMANVSAATSTMLSTTLATVRRVERVTKRSIDAVAAALKKPGKGKKGNKGTSGEPTPAGVDASLAESESTINNELQAIERLRQWIGLDARKPSGPDTASASTDESSDPEAVPVPNRPGVLRAIRRIFGPRHKAGKAKGNKEEGEGGAADDNSPDAELSDAELEHMLQFYPPGKLLHLLDMRRYGPPETDADVGTDGAGAGAGAEEPVSAETGSHLRLLQLPGCDALDHIVVSRHIIHDHMCRNMEAALDSLTLHLEEGYGAAKFTPDTVAGITATPRAAAPVGVEDEGHGMYGGVDWRPRRTFHWN